MIYHIIIDLMDQACQGQYFDYLQPGTVASPQIRQYRYHNRNLPAGALQTEGKFRRAGLLGAPLNAWLNTPLGISPIFYSGYGQIR